MNEPTETQLHPIDTGSRWTDTDGPDFVVKSISIDEDGIPQVHIRTDEGDTLGVTASDMRKRMASGEIAPASTQDTHAAYAYYADGKASGCVIAIDPELKRSDGLHEGYAGTFDRPNSPVSWGAVAPDVLGERLTRSEAKEIHPRLFERIEADRKRNEDAQDAR
jgi:hypothetical protein